MKSALGLFAVGVLLLALGGCSSLWPVVTGSGRSVTYSVPVDSFDRIDVSNCVRVEAARGEAFSVTVSADDNLRDYIELFRNGDTLVARLRSGYSYSRCTVRVVVTMPELMALSASDAADARVDGFSSAGSVALSASDASVIRGSLSCGDLILNLGDASNAALGGSANDLSLTMRDGCDADLLSLSVVSARVSLSDACAARVAASSSISGSIEDASVLRYSGSPSVSVAARDGSAIIHM